MDKRGGDVGPEAEADVEVMKAPSEAAKGTGGSVADSREVVGEAVKGSLEAGEMVVDSLAKTREVSVGVIGGSVGEADGEEVEEEETVVAGSQGAELPAAAVDLCDLLAEAEVNSAQPAEALDSNVYASPSKFDLPIDDGDLESYFLPSPRPLSLEGIEVLATLMYGAPHETIEERVIVPVSSDPIRSPTESEIREQGITELETADPVQHATESVMGEQGAIESETADHVPNANETEIQDEEVTTPAAADSVHHELESTVRLETMITTTTTTQSTHVDDTHHDSSAPQGGENTNPSAIHSKLILPPGFQGHSVLANADIHGFGNASQLSESISNNDRGLTKEQALGLVHNGDTFQIDPSDLPSLDQGGVITIAGNHLPAFPVTVEYHITGKILKERAPKTWKISGVVIQRYEIKGNRWSRTRYTIDNTYHVLEWPAKLIQNEIQVAPRRATTRRSSNADLIASHASVVAALNNFTASNASVAAALNNFTASNASAVASYNNLAGLAAQLVECCKGLLDRQEGSNR